MIEQIIVSHHIQKHIIGVLLRQKTARFRDLRPPKTDTNLFSYHLKLLIKSGLVEKCDGGYTLSPAGLSYVDRVNAEKMVIRQQPKIITMLVIQNSDGDVLLQRRQKQPYIDTWNLPNGKLHIDDASLVASAKREADEKLNVRDQEMTHVGDCYIRVNHGGKIMTVTLVHVFTFNRDDIAINDDLKWVRPHQLHKLKLAPCVEQIISRTFFRDPFFHEEFIQKW